MQLYYRFLIVVLCTNKLLTAQCDSSAEIQAVFKAFNIDHNMLFLQSTPIYLRPTLDAESVRIIKDCTSKKYFVRGITTNGSYTTDTLLLKESEQKELEQLVPLHLKKWQNSQYLKCRIERQVILYDRKVEPSGAILTSYQIMEPIF